MGWGSLRQVLLSAGGWVGRCDEVRVHRGCWQAGSMECGEISMGCSHRQVLLTMGRWASSTEFGQAGATELIITLFAYNIITKE